MLIIPIFGRRRQDDDYKFETSLGYTVSSRLAPTSEASSAGVGVSLTTLKTPLSPRIRGRGHTEEGAILYSIETLNHGGNRRYPSKDLHSALGQVCHREASASGRRAFPAEHFLGVCGRFSLLRVCVRA